MLTAGFAIPVVGVPLFALFAMEVGMDGHLVGRLEIIDEVVSPGPVAFAVPPECGERRREAVGRRGLCERGGEFGGSHRQAQDARY